MVSTYRIAAVARRTGLSADTIRAWERRHGVVVPSRTPSGERQYSEADVERLRLVRAAVDLGHPVRNVASLGDAEIRTLLDVSSEDGAPASTLERSAAERAVRDILDAVRAYDLAAAASLLNAAAVFFMPERLIIDVLAPLMHEVGEAWEAGRISIAQEHFASHLVESVVASFLRTREPVSGATMLFLTPPNEAHVLGLHFAAALAASQGLRPIVLGANVPSDQASQAARGSGAAVVVVGATHAGNLDDLASYARTLRAALPQSISICLGGYAATQMPTQDLPAGIDVVDTLSNFYRSLQYVS